MKFNIGDIFTYTEAYKAHPYFIGGEYEIVKVVETLSNSELSPVAYFKCKLPPPGIDPYWNKTIREFQFDLTRQELKYIKMLRLRPRINKSHLPKWF